MKKILLPLFVGLLLAGCTRSDSKYASSGNSSSNNSATPASGVAKNDPNNNASPVSSAPASSNTASSSMAAVNTPPAAPAEPKEPAPNGSSTASMPSNSAMTPASIASRITEWKLGPSEIKEELQSTGRIVRSKDVTAGAPTGAMSSDVVSNLIKDKFNQDSEISSLKLDVRFDNGTVTLAGAAQSLDQIGKAIALALDTEGVNKAVSEVKVASSTP